MRAWACLRFLCVVLKEKRSKHEFDGNFVFVRVGSVSFCFVYFQMTVIANRRHHTRNLVHGKLDVDETPNHCVTRYSKCSVKIIQTTINIAFAVHGKLDVDETPNHCVTRYSKCSVKIIQTTINIASRRCPNIQHNFCW